MTARYDSRRSTTTAWAKEIRVNQSANLPAGLKQVPVIGILRGCPFRHAVAMAGAAIEAGLTVLEVTLDSERPFDQIATISGAFPDVEIGAGSVRRAQEVAEATEAGARFIVSPIVDEEVIGAARELDVAALPGAVTPTEIEQAMRHGATAVKVFPIEQLGGPAYVRAILSPLGSPPLIPTGGVTAKSIPQYLGAGAIAVGLGGTLFPKPALESGDTSTVAKLAMEVMGALR
jgi:2-dehydro-3-deoxyphosphogluconate aldolase/(4S)-4-hydroxy-2-oxoglutarate aldolase